MRDSGGWIPGDGFQGMESTGEFCEMDSAGMDCEGVDSRGWLSGGWNQRDEN